MSIKNLVIAVIAAAGLAYGGVKGYLYIKVNQQMERLTVAASPFAHIEYGSVGSTLDGVVLLSDIAVRPRGIDDTVNVEQLRIVTPGLGFLLRGGESMSQGEFPERFGMHLQGVTLSLDGALVKMLEEMEAEQSGRQPSPDHVCTLSRDFITDQYRQLGFRQMVFDSSVMFDHRPASTEVRLAIDYVLRGVERGDIAITFTGIGDSIQSAAIGQPLLKRVEAGYKPDADLVARTLEHCAQREGVDVQTYTESLFDKDDDYFAQTIGFIPGPGIRAAIRRMILERGELRIVAEPLSPLDLNTVHLYQPEDWPGLFGLTASVDDNPVTDLSFRVPGYTVDPGKQHSIFNIPGLTQAEEPEPDAVQEAVPEQKRNSPRFRVVDKRRIHELRWKDVRIVTLEGKRRSGTITDVKDGLVYLENRMTGGSMSTQVSIASIKQIEVLE
ncbi:MAG TPA: hypothetical protein VF268_12635 [Gammaproteobacteria bacterium]